MKRSELPPRRKPIARSTYRALGSDEPDPPGEPLIYDTSDGRVMKRWKIAPRSYVERVVRDELGAPVRSRPLVARYRVDVDEAARRYEAGESLPVISRAMGCNTGNLSRLLRSRGVAMRTPTEYATPLDPAVVLQRYADGETVLDISRSLGISDKRVRSVLYASGAKRRKAGRPKGRGDQPGGRVSYETEFAAARPLVRARSRGRCEAEASPNCSGRATHVHHRRMRSQRGSNDLGNLLDVCAWCHAWIHANPRISYDRGWLLRAEVS